MRLGRVWPPPWVLRRVIVLWTVAAMLPSIAPPLVRVAAASSFDVVVQPDTSGTDDSYLMEDQPTKKNGVTNELDLRSSPSGQNRHLVVRIPYAVPAGRTVLQAWLTLTQTAGSNAMPIDARIHPLLEDWSEPDVTWSNRLKSTTWTVPGGTYAKGWTDRALPSQATNGLGVSWQVGPALQGVLLGTTALNGFEIEAGRDAPARDVKFTASDDDHATLRPQLEVRTTDEPPAVRTGTVEVQPRIVKAGASGVPVTLWLAVDASGATPSGAATGVDVVTVATGPLLAVTALDGVAVDGVAQPAAWIESVPGRLTLHLPRVHSVARVKADLRVDVAAVASDDQADLRVTVDDSATPGCWEQALAPGDADGVTGDGDDWILRVSSQAPVSIRVAPDTITVAQGSCVTFGVIGTTTAGDTLTLAPDSVAVRPPALGSATVAGTLCASANATGTGTLIVRYGTLIDSAVVVVRQLQLPSVAGTGLLDGGLQPAAALAPGDTMFVQAQVADGDGFRDVTRLDFDLSLAGHAADAGAPAFHAHAQWTRSPVATWTLTDPAGSSWQVIPSLSLADTSANAAAARTVRLAFVVGRFARASATGGWTIRVSAYSATPPATATDSLAGVGCATRLALEALDGSGAFSWGAAGATALPLTYPPSAALSVAVESNADWSLQGAVSDMAGVTVTTDTLRTGAPAKPVQWALASGAPEGRLDSALVDLGSTVAAAVTEAATTRALRLWIDLAPGLRAQSYSGPLLLRAHAADGTRSLPAGLPLTATVTGSGLAAQSAIAEVTPHVAQAGTVAQPFDVYVLPQIQLGDTGIDRLIVSLPAGYGAVSVAAVDVAGTPVTFADRSAPGRAEVRFSPRVLTSALVHLRVLATVPTALDSLGSPFAVAFDDSSTAAPPQGATEGNANGVADGNSWIVSVTPGSLARITIAPDSLSTFVGRYTTFTARGADAFGNPVTPAVAWSASGGVGTVSASGAFRATAVGRGAVIATSGAVADTAAVTVWQARALAVSAVRGPASVYQGERAVRCQVSVENQDGVPVYLDRVALSFGRGAPGDANADFAATLDGTLPDSLPPASVRTYDFLVDVADDALLGPLAADASASGVELGTGTRLSDAQADTVLALAVTAGGLEIAATQAPRPVRPGETDVPLLALTVHNLYPDARTLAGLTLHDRSVGPAGLDTLDAELGSVTLWRDDGDGRFDPVRDQALVRTTAIDGALHVTPLAVTLAGGAGALLFATADLPLLARDGDSLDVAVLDAADVDCTPGTLVRAAWPLSPPGAFAIDGLVAAQVTVEPGAPVTLLPGVADQLALQVLLPANGYQPDVLERLAVVDPAGTARPGTDIERVRAWVDDGDGAFDPLRDRALGPMVFTGDRWEIGGLAEPVPAAGLRVCVTVDIAQTATPGLTLGLALPAGAYPGVGMRSGDSGPLDRPVTAPSLQTVSDANRMTLSATLIAPGSAHPGDRDLPLLHLVANNGYDTERTLSALVLADHTSGPGTLDERDREVRMLSLRDDADGDGALQARDSLLATGFFVGGRATFGGLHWVVPAHGTRHLWVTAELSPTEAADGDVIACAVDSASAVGFVEPSTLIAGWPLESGARWTVDGFVAAQLGLVPAPAQTLAPGDGPVLALDLLVPANGYRADVLEGVQVVNLGTAGATDIGALRLWRDGGDGAFNGGGGDDVLLGALTPVGGAWQSPLLSLAVARPGARLFVSLDVAAAAAESSTVRLAVPVDGIRTASGDDGPLDLAVAQPSALLISRAPLLATLDAPVASTVGQAVTVRMRVRNTGAETVRAIAPTALALSGGGAVVLAGGPSPATFDLAPATVDTFTWSYGALAVGDVQWRGGAAGTGAASGLTRSAPSVTSATHHVYLAVNDLAVTPVQTMPTAVHRGETDVVPLSLTLTNPGGAGASDVRVSRLRIRLADESGRPVVPASLLARVAVNEGTNLYLSKTTLETSGDAVDLTLATPVRVTGSEPTTLNLRLDVADSTQVSGFRIELPDSTAIGAEDATSGAPCLAALDPGVWPLRSATTRIVEDATDLEVALGAPDSARVAPAASGVTLMRARLVNPGLAGITTDVRVTSVGVVLRDSVGVVVARPGAWLASLAVTRAGVPLGALAVAPGDGPVLTLPLSPPLSVEAGTPVDLAVVGGLAAATPLGTVCLHVVDSTQVQASDALSRAAVAVHLSPAPPAGVRLTVERPADSLRVDGAPALPDTIVIGETRVPALQLALRHPGAPGTARIRIDSLRVACRDGQGRPLAPSDYLARLWLTAGGASLVSTAVIPASGRVALAPSGLLVAPGDTLRLAISLDASATAPAGMLELALGTLDVAAVDANTGVPVSVAAEAAVEMPLRSGVAVVSSPSRDLAVRLESLMPAALAADGRAVSAGRVALADGDPLGGGGIRLEWLRVAAADEARATIPAGAVAERVEAWVEGRLWAASPALTADSLTALLAGAAPLDVPHLGRLDLELRWVPRANGPASRVRLGLDRAGVGVVQPASALLAVQVRADSGQAFPLWSEAGGFVAASLAESYANFPNPFAAGREGTTFAFWLRSPARVTLRILTPAGERVRTLCEDAERAAGLQQSDVWDGRNGRGDAVYNGVYVAELVARYDDGGSERVLRKLAVVR